MSMKEVWRVEPDVNQKENPMHMLFSQIMRLYFLLNYSLLEQLEIHPGQVPLLFELQFHGGLSQKELVNKLMVKPPTMAVMIKRLEKSGIVQRIRDEEDQRITRIFLTPKGAAAAEKIREIMQTVEEECFRDFTPEEIHSSAEMLNRIRENLISACNDQNITCCKHTQRGEDHAETTEIP